MVDHSGPSPGMDRVEVTAQGCGGGGGLSSLSPSDEPTTRTALAIVVLTDSYLHRPHYVPGPFS